METILVVEDDLAVQKALRRLFESEDYAVDVKPDGLAGLEAFQASRPAAVVLDLRLPGLPGHDLCREIKRRAPSLPIIVLSAKTDVADKVLLLEMGAEHPAGRASVRHVENIRAIVRQLADEAELRDTDAFARSWHILIKGSIVAAAEGDLDAAQRAKAMARSLIDRHRRPASQPATPSSP